MKILLDASSVINIVNGEVLEIVVQLPGFEFFIGPQSLDECKNRHPQIEAAIAAGSIRIADDLSVSASRFEDLLQELELGLGETECFVLAEYEAE